MFVLLWTQRLEVINRSSLEGKNRRRVSLFCLYLTVETVQVDHLPNGLVEPFYQGRRVDRFQLIGCWTKAAANFLKRLDDFLASALGGNPSR